MKADSAAYLAGILFLIFLPEVYAEEEHFPVDPVFQRVGVDDGLVQSYVYTILQDDTGFLWFGTDNGLNRFDGRNFHAYIYDEDDDRSISSNHIWSMLQDSSGRIWIGTITAGLNMYHKNRDGFQRFLHDAKRPGSISDNTIIELFEDSSARLWVGTNQGLNLFQDADNTFIRPLDSASNNWTVYALEEDRHGNLIIGTMSKGLFLYSPERGEVQQLCNVQTHPQLGRNFISDVLMLPDHRLLIATNGGGLSVFDMHSRQLSTIPLQGEESMAMDVLVIRRFSEDRIWVGTARDGVFILSKDLSVRANYQYQPEDQRSLSNNYVRDIYMDAGGIIWFGTLSGLSKLDPRRNVFEHFDHIPGRQDSLPAENVFSLVEDSLGYIWIATDAGVSRLSPDSRSLEHFFHDHDDPGSLSTSSVRCVYEDSRGTIWVGTRTNGLNAFDRDSQSFKRYEHTPGDPASLPENYVRVIREADDDSYWLGTNKGLLLFSPSTGEWQQYSKRSGDPQTLSDDVVYAILIDSNNDFWVGTRNGLNQFDPETGRFRQFWFDPEKPGSISDNAIHDFYEAQNGTVWIATNRGLNRYNRSERSFTAFGVEDGFVDDTIYGIQEDRQGNLWLTTNGGLVRFTPQTGNVINFVKEDGLQSNEFNMGADMYSSDGYIYAGGINGFNRFKPEEVKINQHVPPVVVTSVKVFNTEIDIPGEVWAQDEIRLDHRQNFLNISFAALDFSIPEKAQYAYRLDTLDRDWVYTSTPRAVYTDVRPGTYTFRVIASNGSGVWNETGTELRITIIPAFWQTGWFSLLVILVIAGGLAGVALFAVRRNRLRREQLERLVEERTAELSEANEGLEAFTYSVSHDLRSPITNIHGYTDMLKAEMGDQYPEKVSLYLERISRSAEMMNDMIESILWLSRAGRMEVRREQVDLSIIAKDIMASLQRSAPQREADIHIQAGMTVEGDERLLNVALMNLLGNAWKYTAKKPVSRISFTASSGSEVEYRISDNGAGFDQDQAMEVFQPFKRLHTEAEFAGSGIGLATVKKIIERHGGKIRVESEEGVGTVFYFTLEERQGSEGSQDQ